MFRTICFISRTGPDTVVLNPSEPSKEKEKQGFFRAIKKKKKKSQMVTCMPSTSEDASHVWVHYFMHMSFDVCVHTVSPPLLVQMLNASALLLPPFAERYKIISSCCHVHHVSLCHQSCASIFQMQVPDGRPPVIKKCLFPLFSPKNNIKHSSSVRVLPVVSSPMVHAVLHYPTHLLIPCHPSDIACINNNNQECFILSLFSVVFFDVFL